MLCALLTAVYCDENTLLGAFLLGPRHMTELLRCSAVSRLCACCHSLLTSLDFERRVQKLTAPHLSTTSFRAAAEAALAGKFACSPASQHPVGSDQLAVQGQLMALGWLSFPWHP